VKKGGVITEASDRRVGHPATRGRVIELLAQGPATAAALSEELGLSPAGVRRHLDAMYAEGLVSAREQVIRGVHGRHAYDGLATAALRWIAERGGEREVAAFAAAQIASLEQRCEDAVRDSGDDPLARAEALAEALTAQGYAASASTIATGGQLCQHHCPVAHVAAEFPQLCEAETEVIGRLVGTHVQRLATIAHGDGVCTTHIPPKLARPGAPPGGAPAPAGRTELVQIHDGVTMRTDS
jgi:predicted ArsR family transcriptional regulator